MKNLRVSSYIIYIDKTGSNEVLLIHGYTGLFCTVSLFNAVELKCAAGYLSLTEYNGKGFSAVLVEDLSRAGFLTDMNPEEEELFFSGIVDNIQKRKMLKNNIYTIIPSYECNFDCTYCFQKEMRKLRGNCFLEKRLTKEMVLNIFSAMDYLENASQDSEADTLSEKRNICLYGGEPFMKQNHEIVEFIVKEACDRFKPSFSAISNGFEINHFIKLITPELFGNFQITLDGLPDTHDQRRRCNTSNAGTFGRIAENITMLLEKEITVNVRVNIDSDNITILQQLGEEFVKYKWDSFKNFKVTAAPVFTSSEYGRKNFNTGELSEKLTDMKRLSNDTRFFSMQDEKYIQQVAELINSGNPLTSLLKYNYCSAPTNMFGFDPYGEVYTCLEKAGIPGESIGCINKNGILEIDSLKMKSWNKRTVLANDKCRGCGYSLFCGGGCANKAEQLNGTIYSNFCDGFKSLFNSNISDALLQKKRETANL